MRLEGFGVWGLWGVESGTPKRATPSPVNLEMVAFDQPHPKSPIKCPPVFQARHLGLMTVNVRI